jgi:hypothetical protein
MSQTAYVHSYLSISCSRGCDPHPFALCRRRHRLLTSHFKTLALYLTLSAKDGRKSARASHLGLALIRPEHAIWRF